MKNIEEAEKAIQNLIERMNRIEAMQAIHTKPSGEKIIIDIDTSAVSRSVAQIEKALSDIAARKLVTLNGK